MDDRRPGNRSSPEAIVGAAPAAPGARAAVSLPSARIPAFLAALALGLSAGSAAAQQGGGFAIESRVLNCAGHPAEGVTLSSPLYRVSLDSVCDAVAPRALGSDAFLVDGGLVAVYRPPSEVRNLVFSDKVTLQWDPEASVGTYNVYRALISALAGLAFGECSQQDLLGESAADADAVPPGDGFFFLVTAENRLDEEGPKGFQSDGTPRAGSVCP